MRWKVSKKGGGLGGVEIVGWVVRRGSVKVQEQFAISMWNIKLLEEELMDIQSSFDEMISKRKGRPVSAKEKVGKGGEGWEGEGMWWECKETVCHEHVKHQFEEKFIDILSSFDEMKVKWKGGPVLEGILFFLTQQETVPL